MSNDINRRQFVADTGKLALGAMIVPRHVLGGRGFQAPSDTLNIAIVGAGGMGMSNAGQLLSENIVALCDVDFGYVDRSLAGRLRPRQDGTVNPQAIGIRDAYAKATRHTDFREMLAKQRDLDAVVIATPDHLHAPIAIAAMRAGKHVYVQKPLSYSVHEGRAMARAALQTGVVTQMGNQGHSMEGTRRIKELIGSGVIGPVREVHIWTDRPVRYWAQGIPRPVPPTAPAAAGTAAPQQRIPVRKDGAAPRPAQAPAHPRWNMGTVDRAVLAAMAANPQTPPEGMDWNLFLGPAPEIPYHPAYHPFSWRGWTDFGVGAIGDMGAHLMDQPFWALGLGHPTTVSASASPWGGPAANPASYPLAMMAQMEFAARGEQPDVTMYWYDGGLMPPRPPFLPDEITLPRGDGGGGVFIGDRGILTYETYGNNPKVYPAGTAADAEQVARSVPRIDTTHEVNWVQACKGQAQASAPFSYAAPLTEVMLLPIAALRAGPGRKLEFDGPNMRFSNAPEANQYLTRVYRAGWEVV